MHSAPFFPPRTHSNARAQSGNLAYMRSDVSKLGGEGVSGDEFFPPLDALTQRFPVSPSKSQIFFI